MSQIRVSINGFGRIGRLALKLMMQKAQIEIAGINDLTDTRTLAHLLKYDSVHGRMNAAVDYNETSIIINGKEIPVTAIRNPAELPWAKTNTHVVLESTGLFTDVEKAKMHLTAGAKKVLISAPATGDCKTIVLGVNDHILDGNETILSNASCTTNCLAPMLKVLDELCGIETGFMTTVHAYTADQNLQDAPHRDLRRARAAALSIIPTSTGATKAVTIVLPGLKGKLAGTSMRVPVPDGSITDFTAFVKNEKSTDEINAAFKSASENSLKGILEYSTEPLVSADIVGNTHSCIFDSELTMVNGKMVKIVGWYDNETGYSARLVDLILKLG